MRDRLISALRVLLTWACLTVVLLVVQTGQADSLITMQDAKLTANNGAARDYFGYPVSLNGSGNTAVVGAADHDTSAGTNAGSAYVFIRSGNSWVQQAELTAGDGAANDYFGWAVAVSRDGKTVIVGADNDETPAGMFAGSAYVFVRNETNWSQQTKLTAADAAYGDGFGVSVSVSGDGNMAVIGAFQDDTQTAGANAGSAYVFVRNGTNWIQQAKLTASDGAASDYFGYSVSLSSDGSTALIGAVWVDTPAGMDVGSAYVFARSGTNWSQQAKLTASDSDTSAYFGHSVSVSSGGNTAVVGAYNDDTPAGAAAGSAYVFVRNGTNWTQQVKFTANDGTNYDHFGWSVSVNGDGSKALIGAPDNDDSKGAAYMFLRSGNGWSEQAKLTASDGAVFAAFGASVGLNRGGDIALVGASADDSADGKINQGSAYVFRFPELAQGYNRLAIELLDGGAISLTYSGLAGTNYALDHTLNLMPIVLWEAQATNTADSSGYAIFTNVPDPTTNNFWKIRSVP